jgi:methylenetetrahydrofolate dehydrogenase (NADP+)/methenyltetrahydrofolate cyclohydrolase
VSAVIVDGKGIGAEVRAEVAEEVARLRAAGIQPGLRVILVGEDPASEVYVRGKASAADAAGIRSEVVRRPAETTTEDLLAMVRDANADPGVHGLLVQLPLPPHVDARRVLDAIDPDKDVDGLHPVNVGRLVAGTARVVSCTPAGCMEILRRHGVRPAGLEAVVVGRSDIVGKPLALLLLQQSATVTVAHSRTADLGAVTRRADILMVAVGRAGLVTGDMVKPGASVIDVGINRLDPSDPGGRPRLVGDVDRASVEPVAGLLTPVPGGVGPLTIAMLLRNTVTLAQLRVPASA